MKGDKTYGHLFLNAVMLLAVAAFLHTDRTPDLKAVQEQRKGPKIEDLIVDADLAAAFGPIADRIIPRFWTGENAIPSSEFEIDCSQYNLTDAFTLSAQGPLAQQMREVFDAKGVVLLRNTGIGSDLVKMRMLALHALGDEMQYEGGANARDTITKNVYEVGAPLVAHLHYHHEMTYVRHSTKALAFMCAQEVPDRGATFVSDSIAVTDAILKTELGHKLKEKGVCYHRELTDEHAPSSQPVNGRMPVGVYNHWQHSFSTNNPSEATRLAEERGLVVAWENSTDRGRVMKTRYYADAFEWFEPLRRNVLYSSLADHGTWFDSWPYVQHLPLKKRPLHMTFGDDQEFTFEERQLWTDLYDQQGVKIDWRQGDVAVICNWRFAHGRPSIHLKSGEKRQLGVVLGPKFLRQGQHNDRW